MVAAMVHGLILSLGLIIPIGPQNIFILNQGAAHRGMRGALPAVLAAAISDTLLILLAVFSVSVLVLAIPALELGMYAIGFCFLMFIGYSIWKNSFSVQSGGAPPLSARKQMMFATSVSLINPHAVIDTVGVIGTNSLHYHFFYEKVAFAVVCIGVSWVAFIGLAWVGGWVRSVDGKGHLMKMINRCSAIVIWGVALFIGYQLIKRISEVVT
ncbi:LysE family transporter [Bacillus sp. JCM 19041]|uniref:LysE/ArgO family amino acid transporter n=1 Tax=Bacillus sp. JCM 19041 TaxID=1460637 RepID=UPI0006CFE23D